MSYHGCATYRGTIGCFSQILGDQLSCTVRKKSRSLPPKIPQKLILTFTNLEFILNLRKTKVYKLYSSKIENFSVKKFQLEFSKKILAPSIIRPISSYQLLNPRNCKDQTASSRLYSGQLLATARGRLDGPLFPHFRKFAVVDPGNRADDGLNL